MVSDDIIKTIRKLERDLDTVTPFCCTVAGSIAVTSDSLFCTSTWAKLSSVSGVKVRLTVPPPLDVALVVI